MNKDGRNKRILLVEDNEKILRGNKRMLEWEGYAVDAATTLAEAEICIRFNTPHAIILDIMLPDGNGIDFMKKLRQGIYANIPILLLTGLGTQEDIVRGLADGGDDYLVKPYDFSVLFARMEALLRRSMRLPEYVENEDLKLDIISDVAMLNGRDLLLTKKEFLTLLLLVQSAERYVSSEYIYEKVWKMPYTENNNALKSTMKRLRTKLSNSDYVIEWSRDEGYILSKM